MLGPLLHDGLYCMAWTVLAVWRCFLDFAGVMMIWNRSDMHLTSGEIQRRFVLVAQLRVALMGGVG